MLVVGESEWTMKAMHLAATIARRENRELVILKMLSTQATGWSGAPHDFLLLTAKERQLMRNCVATAHDYGIVSVVEYFRYIELPEAICQAAERFEASTVFAVLPSYRFAFWGKFQARQLERHLRRQHCTLHTLAPNDNTADWTPSVVVTS
jgi:hypothetical protein